MKKQVNKVMKKMKAVLVGIAGSHNAFSLSLYNVNGRDFFSNGSSVVKRQAHVLFSL